jgi:hypothetical protein
MPVIPAPVPPAPAQLYCPPEWVCAGWISTITGFRADSVAPVLPADDTTWQVNGAVTMMVVGGTEDPYTAWYQYVFQVECWTANPGSNKPQWLQSQAMAAQIRLATKDRMACKRQVPVVAVTQGPAGPLRTVYPDATVEAAQVLSAQRRAYGQSSDYAGHSFDMALSWVQDGITTR